MPHRLKLLLALTLACGLGWESRAAAAEPSPFASELLTPKGWEQCFIDGGNCEANWELVATSPEILVPAGWADTRAAAAPWGGNMCSELVVPAAWSRRGVHGAAR